MAARVRKAVFPVAGLGTRFLPATKAMPKEMLTVVDRPLIQHVVDEAREAGIEHFIFVTGRNKSVIEDHFDRQFELEQVLAARGKTAELAGPQQRPARAREPRASPASRSRSGLATPSGARASWSATSRSRCSFPTCWCRPRARDVLPRCSTPTPQHGGNIIAVEPVPDDQVKNYGVVSRRRGRRPGASPSTAWWRSRSPGPSHPTSPFSAATFSSLRSSPFSSAQEKGAGGEIQLTDAMLALLKRQPFYAVKYEGRTFDCGSKAGLSDRQCRLRAGPARSRRSRSPPRSRS